MTRPQKDGFEFYFALDTHCKVRDYAIRNDTGEAVRAVYPTQCRRTALGRKLSRLLALSIHDSGRRAPPDPPAGAAHRPRFPAKQPADPARRGCGAAAHRAPARCRLCWQMNIPYLSPEAELERLRHHDGYERAMFCFGEADETAVKIRHPDYRRDSAGIVTIHRNAPRSTTFHRDVGLLSAALLPPSITGYAVADVSAPAVRYRLAEVRRSVPARP